MRTALDTLYKVAGGLAAVILLMIAVLVVIQMGSRIVGVLVPGVDDYAAFSLAGTTFLALAYTLRSGTHVRVSLILQRVHSPRLRRLIDIWCIFAGAVASGYFALYSAEFVWESYIFKEVAHTLLPTPLWIPRLTMPIGLTILFIAFVDDLVQVLSGNSPSYANAPDESAAARKIKD